MSVLQLDPTQTIMIRKEFEADARRRWNEFKALLALVFTYWALDKNRNDDMALGQVGAAYARTFLAAGSLTRYWFDPYIQRAYVRALDRAYTTVRRPVEKQPTIGGRKEFRVLAMQGATPVLNAHSAVTYQRFAVLGEQIKTAVAVALAEGGAQGQTTAGITETAKRAVGVLVTNRAPLVVNEAVTRTFTGGTLDAYALLGVKQVGADVEFVTAAGQGASAQQMDALRVCPKCQALSGKVYTLAASRGVIPVHPRCRCRWVPA